MPSSDSFRPPGYPGYNEADPLVTGLVQVTVPPYFRLRVRPPTHDARDDRAIVLVLATGWGPGEIGRCGSRLARSRYPAPCVFAVC